MEYVNLNTIKVLTEYFKYRCKIRKITFTGFNVITPSKELLKYSKPVALKYMDTTVYFFDVLKVKILKQFLQINEHIILIYDHKTIECDKLLTNNIEGFSNKELQYNIFKNFMVPQVYLLDEDEKNNHNNYYGIHKNPSININDPICRYLRLKKGDIIRFNRKSNKDTVFYYREVI